MQKQKRFVIVMELKAIHFLNKAGVRPSTQTGHLLTGSVIWPRTGFPSRSYAMEVKAGAERTYEAADWADAILMKETLQAPTALKLQLSVPLGPEILRDWGKRLAKLLGKEAGGLVEDAVPGLAGDLLRVPVDWVAAYLAEAAPETLGEGLIQLDEKMLSEGGVFDIDLKAPATRYRTQSPAKSNPGGKATVRRKILTAGETVATVSLRLYPVE